GRADVDRLGGADAGAHQQADGEQFSKIHASPNSMHTFFGSVKKRNASTPPSRPTPLCLTPPNGVRRSRRIQQLIQTMPDSSREATRCARFRFVGQTDAARP